MTELQPRHLAPDFALTADDGSVKRLSDYRGKKVVLYFYPKDDTPGCTMEAKDFAELAEQFTATDAVIIGISKDNTAKHCAFKEKYGLPFTLLTDSEKLVESYGLWVEKSLYGRKYWGIDRATLLIDREGVIQRIWRKVKVKGHAEEVLKAAQTLA